MADLRLIRALGVRPKRIYIVLFILGKSRGKKNNGSTKELKLFPLIDVCMDKQTFVVGSHASRLHRKDKQSFFFILKYSVPYYGHFSKTQCVQPSKIL